MYKIAVFFLSFSLSAVPFVDSKKELIRIFPLSNEELSQYVTEKSDAYIASLEKLLDTEKRTFSSIVLQYDRLQGDMGSAISILQALSMIHPDADLSEQYSKAALSLQKLATETYYGHPELYDLLSSVTPDKQIQGAEYVQNELLKQMRHSGLHEASGVRKTLTELDLHISYLGEEFEKNIRTDQKFLLVDKHDLTGLSPQFIQALQKDGSQVKLTVDYPTVNPILERCGNEAIRKSLRHLFMTRASPENDAVLRLLVQLREKQAQLLGYATYADFQLSMETIGSQAKARSFILDLASRMQKKQAQEMVNLETNLPAGVNIMPSHKIASWDLKYTQSYFKETKYHVDSEKIAEYFPLEQTLENLLKIYSQFFSLSFKSINVDGLWHPDVRLISVSDAKSKKLLGYILLDLFPRKGKYSHACQCGLIPAWNYGKKEYPAVSLVITNFTKPLEGVPSLLKHSEVLTFFHEFGHALHYTLGRTRFMTASGTSVPIDFVELPSQLLEEWMWEPAILKQISSHYKTKKQMPSSLIDSLVSTRNLFSGTGTIQQCINSLISLDIYSKPLPDHISDISLQLSKKWQPQIYFPPDDNFPCSFGHLVGYGALYYGYLWTRMQAADVFQKIKAEGLLNPKVGMEYRKMILAPGGTKDPTVMIEEFLGRPVDPDAFMKSLGVE